MQELHPGDVLAVCGAFALHGTPVSAEPFGNGHINDTFRIRTQDEAGHPTEYILQRINTSIFRDPLAVMRNIRAVTEHVARRIRARGGDALRQTLTVVSARDGAPCYFDADGSCWRADLMITDSVSHDTADSPAMLESAARTFGEFFMDLDDFPADQLAETIPLFHNTPNRLRQFEEAVARDAAGRAQDVAKEIADVRAFAGETGYLTDRLADGRLPLRVTHNDTKLNNILFDRRTNEGLCVIDLDTVMPGLTAYDFGDAIRVGGNTADEGDPDISHVSISLPNFTAFARGFLSAVHGVITDEEAASLVMGAKLMTWECASRFLADYLNGDVYFKIHYPTQNLDRARNQIALVQDIDRHQAQLEAIVKSVLREVRGEKG